MQTIGFHELEAREQTLLLRAEQVMMHAYSPYSTFCVGAAVLGEDGSTHVGTNVENAVFDLTIHAEASALSAANTAGVRRLSALAVIGRPRDGISAEPVMPCGICRQNLYEFAQLGSGDLRIIASNTDKDKIILTSVTELLPQAFGPKDVGVNLEPYRQ